MTQRVVVLTAGNDVFEVEDLATIAEITKKVREKHGLLNEGQPNEKNHAWILRGMDDTLPLSGETVDMINSVLHRMSSDPHAMEILIHLTNMDQTVMETVDQHELAGWHLVWLLGAYDGDFQALLAAFQDESFLTILENYPTDD